METPDQTTPEKIIAGIKDPDLNSITIQVTEEYYFVDYKLGSTLTAKQLAKIAGLTLNAANTLAGVMREDAEKSNADIEEFNIELLNWRQNKPRD
jgi:hypothetical protein